MTEASKALHYACMFSIVALALVEPITHAWQLWLPPDGYAATGLRINDYAFILPAYRMLETGFFNPYALCGDPLPAHHYSHFAFPHSWMYGAAGYLLQLAGLPALLGLGVFAGAGMALYLLSVYRFLRVAAPRVAELAFLLFCWGGGLGGWLYLVTGGLGWHDAPAFDERFLRFARYELIEGPHMFPVLLGPRPYYSLPLAVGFAMLTSYVRVQGGGSWRPYITLLPFFGLAVFINVRIGPMFIAVAACYWIASNFNAPRRQLASLAMLALAAAMGGSAAWAVMGLKPAVVDDVTVLLRRSIWLSSFASASLFLCALSAGPIIQNLRRERGAQQWFTLPALGFIAAFVLGYILFQILYGSLIHPADYSAAVRISDYALAGALAGFVVALVRRRTKSSDRHHDNSAWFVLWLLLFVAAGIAALGQGWYLRLMPERLLVLVPAPLAVLAAQGYRMVYERWQHTARIAAAAVLASGIVSSGIAALYFQGPLGWQDKQGPFSQFHNAFMPVEDAQSITAMRGGTVLCSSIIYGDILAQQRDTSSTHGLGVQDYGNGDYYERSEPLVEFFEPGTDGERRRAIAENFCADWIYSPAMEPADPQTLMELKSLDWLEEVETPGNATIFRVKGSS